MIDCYGIKHLFVDYEPEQLFREATIEERNIVSATEVNMKEFMKDRDYYSSEVTLHDIYRMGAEAMLQHIRANLSIKG